MEISLQVKKESKVKLSPVVKLKLTPRMKQAIDILQLPFLDLRKLLDKELIENPLLEETSPHSSQETELIEDIDRILKHAEAKEDSLACNKEGFSISQRKKDFLESTLTKPTTLQEYLLKQAGILKLSVIEQRIIKMIVGSLDENGYLKLSLGEISDNLGVAVSKVQKILSKVQQFDPQGVAARNLEECLLIQLQAKKISSFLLERIIKEHLQDLEKKNYQLIAKSLSVSVSEVELACLEITQLDPKPGRRFSIQQKINIIPDLRLERMDEKYQIIDNVERLFILKVSPSYKRMLNQKNISTLTKKYIKGKLNSALWLLDSLKQRQETILKITNCIIDLQKDFLDKGIQYLNPLQLQDVADKIGIHKSTVSRAIAGKYIQTPQGLLELKYFFDQGSKSIREKIKDLIDQEDPLNPINDQGIVKFLNNQGVQLARRTVVKYRQQLGIPPAYLRKQTRNINGSEDTRSR